MRSKPKKRVQSKLKVKRKASPLPSASRRKRRKPVVQSTVFARALREEVKEKVVTRWKWRTSKQFVFEVEKEIDNKVVFIK